MTRAKGYRPNRKAKVSPEQVATWIAWYIRTQGYAPTGGDLARAFEMSAQTGRRWMSDAEARGYIWRGKGLRNVVVMYARTV